MTGEPGRLRADVREANQLADAINRARCPDCDGRHFKVSIGAGTELECSEPACGSKFTISHGAGDVMHVERAAA